MEHGDILEIEERKDYLTTTLKIPYLDLETIEIDSQIIMLLDEREARYYQVIPVEQSRAGVIMAMYDPTDQEALNDLYLITQQEICPCLAKKDAILQAINQLYSGQQMIKAVASIEMSREKRKLFKQKRMLSAEREEEGAPIIKMVEGIFEQARRLRTSDIHIEVFEATTRIRMRIDGLLQEKMRLDRANHDMLLTRLKLMANMNIAEKRLPQDGSFQLEIEGEKLAIRAATLPTSYGEKMVLRMLPLEEKAMSTFEELGLLGREKERFERLLKQPQGMILVTGPTGSGKSTTLYTALEHTRHTASNTMTLEEPIEKHLEGINQIQINPKIGLTFASGLRAMLRQDPDCIMVGEIRDTETAQIAIRAAITGHLVLSTVHTNDSVSTLVRLMDMGIPSYLLSAALTGVVAQRLVRCICPKCKETYEASESDQQLLGCQKGTQLGRGRGCQVCGFTGYQGRTAIYELLLVTEKIQKYIHQGVTTETIKQCAREEGMQTLEEHLYRLVITGQTTTKEYKRLKGL